MKSFRNIYIYARASSKGSKAHRQKNTIPGQIEDCTNWANSEGLNITKVFQERESGKVSNTNRPIFSQLLKTLKKNDLLIINCRDRLGRNSMNSQRISDDICSKIGADIYDLETGHYFSDTYDNDVTYLTTILKDREAQNESKKLSKRIKRGLKVKKDNNQKWTNIAPLGSSWDNDDMLTTNTEEAAMIEDIRLMRTNGLSFKEIALECQRKNYLNRAGKVPSQSSLSKMCKGITIQINRNLENRTPRLRLEDRSAGMQEHIIKLRSQGLSMRKIANELNDMGYSTSKGGDIKHTQIARIIKNLGI